MSSQLLLPGELAKFAASEMVKVNTNYGGVTATSHLKKQKKKKKTTESSECRDHLTEYILKNYSHDKRCLKSESTFIQSTGNGHIMQEGLCGLIAPVGALLNLTLTLNR